MRNSLKYFIAGYALLSTVNATAQISVLGRWEANVVNRKVAANDGLPQGCLPTITRAVSRVNGMGSQFTMSYTNPTWTSYTNQTAPNDYPNTIVYAATMSVPTRVAETALSYKTTAPLASPAGIKYFASADVALDRNQIFYYSGTVGGNFHCPSSGGTAVPAGKYDLEYTLSHEFAHVAGLSHNSNSACPMFDRQDPGKAMPAFCADEISTLQHATMYGRR